MKTSTVKPHFKWNGFREQYMGIIQNLINNIDICNNYDVIISKFLFIINKLYNKKYLNSIIKEVKPFLSDDIY